MCVRDPLNSRKKFNFKRLALLANKSQKTCIIDRIQTLHPETTVKNLNHHISTNDKKITENHILLRNTTRYPSTCTLSSSEHRGSMVTRSLSTNGPACDGSKCCVSTVNIQTDRRTCNQLSDGLCNGRVV